MFMACCPEQNQISSHQLQSPSLPGGGGQRFGMPGGGSGSSSVSPSEAEVAAASLVNAPLLKGILAQVGSPGGGGSMTSSGGGSVGGRQSVSLPLMDKKMMDNEEMKAVSISPGMAANHANFSLNSRWKCHAKKTKIRPNSQFFTLKPRKNTVFQVFQFNLDE